MYSVLLICASKIKDDDDDDIWYKLQCKRDSAGCDNKHNVRCWEQNMLSKGLIKQGLGAVVGTRVQLVIRQYTYSDISFYDVGGRVNT